MTEYKPLSNEEIAELQDLLSQGFYINHGTFGRLLATIEADRKRIAELKDRVLVLERYLERSHFDAEEIAELLAQGE